MSGSAPDSLTGKGPSKAPKFQQLGKYRLVARLGQGGMGVVYKAVDTLDRTVAVKILASHLASNQKYVGRFLREARSAAALSHPNIVGALDVGQEGNYYYFAMEFVDGVTVKSRLKAEGRLSEVEAVNIVLQVARALQHAASKSIIHRDIKPDNIMISKHGEVKLTDMGLAKATDDTGATITQAGSMIGTPQYASPEQIRGELTIDPRTDIYSLGMTLFQMVVGRAAFDGETAAVVNAKHLGEPLPDIKAARPDLSDGLCRVIQKMCQKEVANRYQSPDPLIEDLELVRSGQAPKHAGPLPSVQLPGGPAAPGAAPRLTGMGAGAIAGVVGAVALGALAIYFMAGRQPPSPAVNTTAGATPRVSTVPVAPKQDAKTALEEARKLAETRPGDIGAIVNLYSSVLKFQGTPEAKAAQAEIDKRNAEVQAAFDEKEREVKAHTDRSAYGDALTALDTFPEKYRFGAWAGHHAALKERWEGSIMAAFKKVEEGAAKAVQAGDFSLARQLYKESLAQFPPAYALTAEKTLDDIEAKQEAHQERLAALKTKLYKAFLTRIEGAQKTRDYAGVQKAAETAAADPVQAALKPALEMEAEHARLLLRLLELAEQGAAKRKGKTCRFEKLGLKGMPLKDVRNGQLVFAGEGGLEITLSVAKQLKTAELMDLAKAELEAQEHRNVILGAFHFAEGDFKAARNYWESAVKDGKDVSQALEKLDMVTLDKKELDARAALAKVRSCFDRKKWGETIKLIGDVQTAYKETQAVSKAARELAEMLRQSKENLAAAAAATAEAEKEDEEETPAAPSGPPSRQTDGLEQYTDWTVSSCFDTGTGKTSFGGLNGDRDPNRVIRLSYSGALRGVFIARRASYDFSKTKYLAVRVHNRSEKKVRIVLGMNTGPFFVYYEGLAKEFPPGKTTYHRFGLTIPFYTRWTNAGSVTEKVPYLQDVRRVVLTVYPGAPDGEVVLEYIGLED